MDNLANNDLPVYTISTAAELLNVSVHTLRLYEREGLIIPFKKESNHRLYSKSDIDRLNCIRDAINEMKISINGIKTIFSLIPCWDIKGCSEVERNNCPAYKSAGNPCWTFDHKDNACSTNSCRTCSVYKDMAQCHQIKESIIHSTSK